MTGKIRKFFNQHDTQFFQMLALGGLGAGVAVGAASAFNVVAQATGVPALQDFPVKTALSVIGGSMVFGSLAYAGRNMSSGDGPHSAAEERKDKANLAVFFFSIGLVLANVQSMSGGADIEKPRHFMAPANRIALH